MYSNHPTPYSPATMLDCQRHSRAAEQRTSAAAAIAETAMEELRAEEFRQRGKEIRRAHLEAKMREHEAAMEELEDEMGALEELDEDFITPGETLDDFADYDETTRSARRNHRRELSRPDPLDLDDERTHAAFDSLALDL